MAEKVGLDKRKKLIIDTDCGADDAQAIILALSKKYRESVEIMAITCAAGNVDVDKVVINVLKTLKACGRTDIPVYKGAASALIAHDTDAASFHGNDGLCDLNHVMQPSTTLLKNENAFSYLSRITKEHPKSITLIAIGPLTNLALTQKIDPMFSGNLKSVSIMGGNHFGKGNVTVAAEFNFYYDPESASIVLNEFSCPMEIVTWETCLDMPLDPTFIKKYENGETKWGKFLGAITHTMVETHYEQIGEPFLTCDPLAVAIVVEPDVVSKYQEVYATVELAGKYTRGQMVVDWRRILKRENNIKIIEKMDLEKFKLMLLSSVQ